MHRETRISNYVLAFLSAASLALLALPTAGPVQSFRSAVIYLLHPGFYYGSEGGQKLSVLPERARHLIEADIENDRLRSELKKDEWMEAELNSLRIENEGLTREMGLKAPAGFSPVWARVIERDPSRWYNVLMVDAGKDKDLDVDAPVLGAGPDGRLALVGRIAEVRAESSVLLLATDGLSSVAAYVQAVSSGSEDSGQDELGLIQGQDGPLLKLNYLSPESDLKIGSRVLTSAISAVFPPDVPVGVVERIDPPDPFLTFRSAAVRPAVSASTLKEVMILKSRKKSEAAPEAETEDDEP